MTKTSTDTNAVVEAAARHAAKVARERQLADLEERRRAARRADQARFDEVGLPRGAFNPKP